MLTVIGSLLVTKVLPMSSQQYRAVNWIVNMSTAANLKDFKKSTRRHIRMSVPMSEINVTPFVDVMLVLLIIFMVAAPMSVSYTHLTLPTIYSV